MSKDTPNGKKLGLTIVAVITSAIITAVSWWAQQMSTRQSEHDVRIRLNERELQRLNGLHKATENGDEPAGD